MKAGVEVISVLIPNTSFYRLLVRPLLFRLPPEVAQQAAEAVLQQSLPWRALSLMLQVHSPRLGVRLCGLKLANPVGLAAGYDKDCRVLPSLAALGFGYLTGGTVTELPRQGNPRPRVLRYVKDQSLINALGFPGRGVESAARRLERAQQHLRGTPVVVSISGETAESIVRCYRRLEPLVNAVEVNISSPNTAGLREFHEPAKLAALLGGVNEVRRKPLFLKLPTYAAFESAGQSGGQARDQVMRIVKTCVTHGVDALTVANSRPAQDRRLAVGNGGISGRLVFGDMLTMVAEIRAEAGKAVAINACGGIFSANDAWQALQAGATTVQLLTGLIYRGPGIVGEINRGLLRTMDNEGVSSLQA